MDKGELYKFKAETLRAAGFIFCSSFGLVFIEIFKRNLNLDRGLTIWLITSILSAVFGLNCLIRSVELLEEYKHGDRIN